VSTAGPPPPGGQPPPGGPGRPPSEEELLAAYEEQVKHLRVEDVIAQTVVSLLNLGARKAGLVPGSEGERDLGQVRTSIDAARGLLPLIESALGPDAPQLRNALAQLQIAYARLSGSEAAPAGEPGAPQAPPAGPSAPGEPASGPGPAQRSGRLWIPGQGPPR
jgi:hypothetical protein